MKLIAREMRVVKGRDVTKVLSQSVTDVFEDKRGVYKHGEKHYLYVGSTYFIDYFKEFKEPLKLGIKLLKDL